MADPLHTIAATLRDAFAQATGLPADAIDPVVRPSDRADAQANGALALGKQVGRNPRDIAEAAAATGLLAPFCSAVEVAGPGAGGVAVPGAEGTVLLASDDPDADGPFTGRLGPDAAVVVQIQTSLQ